jgi:hypothetical protein
MKKFAVQYLRVEHHVYFLEVDAQDANHAELVAHDVFDGSEPSEIVQAEEFILEVKELETA